MINLAADHLAVLSCRSVPVRATSDESSTAEELVDRGVVIGEDVGVAHEVGQVISGQYGDLGHERDR